MHPSWVLHGSPSLAAYPHVFEMQRAPSSHWMPLRLESQAPPTGIFAIHAPGYSSVPSPLVLQCIPSTHTWWFGRQGAPAVNLGVQSEVSKLQKSSVEHSNPS